MKTPPKNSRDYGKSPRLGFAAGGPIYDYFGNVTTDAHINKAGGLVSGKASKYDTEGSFGESSTFNQPSSGPVSGALLSGGLAAPKAKSRRGLGDALRQAGRIARARSKGPPAEDTGSGGDSSEATDE